MRLTTKQLAIIKTCFTEAFLKEDHLWLFGSRVDDSKRGGDIDLYIETHCDDIKKADSMLSTFCIELQDHLGEQKIDIIVKVLAQNKTLRIYQEARDTGILLV